MLRKVALATILAVASIVSASVFSQDSGSDTGSFRIADADSSKVSRTSSTNRTSGSKQRASLAERLQNARGDASNRPREIDGDSDQDSGAAEGPALISPPTRGSSSTRATDEENGDETETQRGTGKPNFRDPRGTSDIPSVLKKPSSSAGRSSVADKSDESGVSRRTEKSGRVESSKIPAGPQRVASQRIGGAKQEAAAKSDGIRLTSKGPNIHVETNGPKAIKIGREAEFQVDLFNDGNDAAGEVHVRIALPEWVQVVDAQGGVGEAKVQNDETGGSRITWALDGLAAQAQQQLKLKLIPKQNRPFELIVDWTLRPTSAAAQIEVQQPQIQVSVFGPKDVQFGESALYTIALSNPGTGDAEDVVVSLTPGDGSPESKRIGTIGAGEQQELKVELVARKEGTMKISAQAVAAGGLQADATEEILVRRAQLQVEVEGPEARFVGGSATYQIRLANLGNAIANDTELQITLPPGAKVLSGLEGGSATANGAVFSITNFAPNAERVIEITCALMSPGDNDFVVKARTEEQEVSANCVTRIETVADLKLVINDPQGPRTVGEEVSYEIVITNRGSKAAEGIEIIAEFSEGVEPTQSQGGPAEIVPGQVYFKPIARLEPGQQVTFKVSAKADRPGAHRFRSQVMADAREIQLVTEATTRFYGAEMTRSSAKQKTNAKK